MKIPADQLSDAELEALIALPALKQRESGGRPGVMGPQTQWGRAVGSTQMLPDTAKAVAAKVGLPWRPDLLSGTTPEAASYQDTLGHAYLTEGIAKTGSLEDGLRYYHGGPDRRQWGPKTEAYAKAVAANAGYQPQPSKSLDTLSNEELDALIAQKQGAAASAAPAPPVQVGAMDKPVSGPVTLGQMQAFAGVKPKSQAYGFAKGAVDQNVRLAEIAKSMPMFDPKAMPATAFSPGGMLANVLLQRGISAGKGLQGQVDRMGQGLQPGKLGEIAGSILGSAWLPGGVMTQGAVSGAAQSQSDNPIDIVRNGLVGAATGYVASKAFEGLGSIIAKPFMASAKPMDFAALTQAKDAAYAAAKQSGATYADEQFNAFKTGLQQSLAASSLNPLRHPKAASMLDDINRVTGDQTLESLDQLRQVIYRDVASASDQSEARLGKQMIKALDAFIESNPAGSAAIKTARDLNTRVMKIEAVSNAAESAALQNGARYFGGNEANAVRQKLRPFIDPTAAKKIGNLTPDEAAQLKKVVIGTPVQNALRNVSFFAPNRMGGQIAGMMGIPTMGLSTAVLPAGALAQTISTGMTKKQLDDLIKLMASGGNISALKPVQTATSQAIKKAAQVVARPMGLIGGTAAGLLGGTATAKPTAKPKPKPAK